MMYCFDAVNIIKSNYVLKLHHIRPPKSLGILLLASRVLYKYNNQSGVKYIAELYEEG